VWQFPPVMSRRCAYACGLGPQFARATIRSAYRDNSTHLSSGIVTRNNRGTLFSGIEQLTPGWVGYRDRISCEPDPCQATAPGPGLHGPSIRVSASPASWSATLGGEASGIGTERYDIRAWPGDRSYD
jgi:hypothetical protein